MIVTELSQFSLSQSHTWYVKSSSDQSCPWNTSCHTISFYAGNPKKYFVSNTTFIFMSGSHLLNFSSPYIVSNANSLTLTGQQLDDKRTFFKIPTLRCVKGTFGFTFMDSSSIEIRSLVIKNCGPSIHDGGLRITNVEKVIIGNIIVKETRGIGVMLDGIRDALVYHSIFANNGLGIKKCSHEYQWSHGVRITASKYKQVNYNITESKFTGNSKSEQVGGGLFISTNDTQSTSVLISRCQFIKVISCPSSGASIFINNFEKNVIVEVSDTCFSKNSAMIDMHGATGALTIQANQAKNASSKSDRSLSEIKISNSSFYKNRAYNCAGISIFLASVNTDGLLIIQNINILDNFAQHEVGGVCIQPKFLKENGHFQKPNLHIRISDSKFKHIKGKNGTALHVWPQWSGKGKSSLALSGCVFESNSADTNLKCIENSCRGGTVTIQLVTPNTFVLVKSCFFVNNAVGPNLNLLTQPSFTREKGLIKLANVTVRSSKFMRDSVVIICSSLVTHVKLFNVTIIDNDATGLSSLNCALEFKGYNLIANNTTPFGGGGLLINGTGYAHTTKGATVVFINNTAAFGGALYSSFPVMSVKQYLNSSPCTFLGLNATFVNNKATIAGNDLYGGNMMYCTYFLLGFVLYYNQLPGRCVKSPYRFLRQKNSTGISSNPYNVYACNIKNGSINYTNTFIIKVFPGSAFKVPLITTGYCNGISPGVLKISSSLGIHIAIADIQSTKTGITCEEKKYTLKVSSDVVTKGNMNISVGKSEYGKKLKVNFNILRCPYGMEINKNNGICECEDAIIGINGLQCNISDWPDPILKKLDQNKVWLAYNKEKNCTTVVPDCPFDYCNPNEYYFNLNNNTDQQCNHNRTGTLCGSCQKGLSLMLGSNACSECSNMYLFILILFILAGILLVVILIALNMTVSVGSINGLLFYANIVKLNQPAFFPDGTIPVISHFISWLNLDFGFEVCFFNGLNGYWKIWLQFVFPLYIWLLAIIIIVSSHHSIRISRYLRSNIISVLATLVLISFTKILRNITNALMVTKLHCGRYQQLVWSIDGNISYFNYHHSILIAFSVVVLICSLTYSCFLFLSQWLQRYCNECCCGFSGKLFFKLQPFVDAYTGPFNERHRYWTGLLLLVRLALMFIFTYTSGSMNYINNYMIIVCEFILTSSVLKSNTYQKQINNLYEKCFHINLGILCLGNSVISQSSYKQYISSITIISVAVCMLLFIVIVTQQIFSQCSKKHGCKITFQEEQPLLAKCGNQRDEANNSPQELLYQRDSIIF